MTEAYLLAFNNKNTIFRICFTLKLKIMYHNTLITKDHPQQAELEKVIELMLATLGKCSIYMFGYRECHFYILLFADVSLRGTQLMNEIKESTHKTITATVLAHNVKQLATKQKSQQYFFDQVLQNGQRMALDKAHVPYILNHNPQRDVEADRAYWHKCFAVAQFHLQAVADSEHIDITLCKIALLNTAATQIALGLLRVFLGYTPNEFGLKYLLQLCGHFTVMPSQLFHQQTPEAIRRYKMLCAPTSMLNHWTRLNAAEEDFVWLLDSCRTFLGLATELVTPEFQRLENTLTKSVPS